MAAEIIFHTLKDGKLSKPQLRRYRLQAVISIFFVMFTGCAFISNSNQVDSDYKILLNEQIEIQDNEGLNVPYQQAMEDFQAFKELLYSAIEKKYADQFREDELNQIKQLLTEEISPQKYQSDVGTAIFQRFQGSWRGQWYQNRRSTTYDHSWSPPYIINGGLVAQKVIIRKWDNRNEKPASEIVAINSYNPENQMILGAVDVAGPDRKNTLAPHLGFYIDPSSLIWIACFGNDSENPSYSFFFEKIYIIDQVNHYRIRGVGFNWNRRSNRLININWQEGHYVQVKPKRPASDPPYTFGESPF
jgi:hypothetical protein